MDKFFDLTNPQEKAIYDSLLEYFKNNLTQDQVLYRIGKDFPYMSDKLRYKCEIAVFAHYEVGEDDNMTAEFKDMVLLHSSKKDDPHCSHLGTRFHIWEDEDVYLSIMVENKHFLYKEAHMHYSIYVNDVKVNEFKHAMSEDERRNTYTLPLNLIEKVLIEEKKYYELEVKVVDEIIKDREYTKKLEIYHGEEGAEDVFDLYYKHLTYVPDDRDEDLDGDFYENWIDVNIRLRYDEYIYGSIPVLEAIGVLSPAGAKSKDYDRARRMYMFERYDCSGDITLDYRFPIDGLDGDELEFKLYIWDRLLWSEKISLDGDLELCEEGAAEVKPDEETEVNESAENEEKDEFDALLDEFVMSMLLTEKVKAAVSVELFDEDGNLVSCEADRYLHVKNDPSKIKVRILFDEECENNEDLLVEVKSYGWPCSLKYTIPGAEFDSIKGKPYEIELNTLGMEIESLETFYVKISPVDCSYFIDQVYTILRFDSPHEILDLQALKIYNVSGKDLLFWSSISDKPSQTAFRAEDMEVMSVLGQFKNVQNLDFEAKNTVMTWNLYSEIGILLDSQTSDFDYSNDCVNTFAKFGEFNDNKWKPGNYKIELKWFDETMLSAIVNIGDRDNSSEYDPHIIRRKSSIVQTGVTTSALERLDNMAGLEDIKKQVHSFVNYTKLQQKRKAAGLPVKQPALHARFLGNPGTGKTTVAKILGQVYKELGLLSSGHVVVEERKNFMGRYYDSEVAAVENAISRAQGGILLIDEAYNLYVENDDKDPGKRVLEYLLTALSDENKRDWMLILAGYPKEMERMLNSNPGIKSRVSDTYTFKDYDVDTLMEIAEIYCRDNSYKLSSAARETLRSVITFEHDRKDKHFGNGRFVNKLMDKTISTNMATRVGSIENPTVEQLMTIEAEDIVGDSEEASRIATGSFDEEAIDEALKKLDSLVGLRKVKSAIHNFVHIARYLNSQGEKFTGKGLLKWNFTGNTGTGKSTVAQILADILKAMNLIQNNEVTEIKGEEIFNVSEYACNETLKEAVKKHQKGMLHIDGDAPEFRSHEYRMTNEQVRLKLTNLIKEDKSSGAIIISECSSPKQSIAYSLANNGVYDYDHIFIFDDYTEEELYDILLQCLDKYRLTMSAEAEASLRNYIHNLCCNRELSFANARTMKTLSRAIYELVLLRISKEKQPSDKRIILGCDVESFVWKTVSHKIGF